MSHLLTVPADGLGLSVTSASFTVPATATYCLLRVLMRGGDGADTTVTTATLGAQSFTFNSGSLRRFDGYQAIEVGYILAADLPSGSQTITVNRASGTDGIIVAATFVDDAAQVAPLVAFNGYASSPPDPVTTSITTTGDALLLDAIGTSTPVPTLTVQETGQTESSNFTGGAGDASMATSYRSVTGAASHAMSWDTAANSARTTHVVLAIESGTPIAEPDPEQATTGNIPLTPAAGWTSYGLVNPVFTLTSTLRDYTGDAAVTSDALEVGPITGLGAGMSISFLPDGRYNIEDPNGTWVDDISFPRRVIQADGTIGITQVMTIDAAIREIVSVTDPLVSGNTDAVANVTEILETSTTKSLRLGGKALPIQLWGTESLAQTWTPDWLPALVGGGSGPTSTPDLFADGFESQDLSASSASVNTVNFAWTDSNRSSVLTQVDASTARRVFPVAFIEDYTDGRDVTAKNGSYSMGLEYAANTEMAEQRFSFDAQDEVWIRYWTRVPENFYQGTMNNKWMSIWQGAVGDYDSFGTLTWQTRPTSGGNAQLVVSDGGSLGSELLGTPFIDISTDLGRWMQVVIHIKGATSGSSNDGLLQFYRRWEDEESFTLMQENTGLIRQYNNGAGYAHGYIFGWANDPYDEDTWWLVDDFEMSTGSLL